MRIKAYVLYAAICAVAVPFIARTPFTAVASAQTPSQLLMACADHSDVSAGAAVEACTALIEAETSDVVRARHYVSRSQAHWRQRDLLAALHDLDEAIRLDPSCPPFEMRAMVRLKLKMFEGAFADADAAQRLAKGSPGSLNTSCWVRAAAGLELKAARSACERALRLLPHDPAILDTRGLLRLQLGDNEGARADYAEALRWASDVAGHRYGFGIALMRLGRTAEGQQEIAAAIKMSESIAADFESFGIKP